MKPAFLFVLLFPLSLSAQALSPEASLKAMKLPDGFSVECVAHEPMIRQPVSMSFDERGRLWVLQYLQYPNYEGLKPIKQDQYLRTIWDKFPEPPPKGPKGLDKITILSDVGPDGKYRQSKDFVTGLNIASGFCIGNGGVYVVQPPYLLYYADKNHDDIPDGDPEVLLTGFGMDDTHSLANSLQWGPDGWLYGAAGSTSTCKISNPANPKEIVEFQQGVWRYHPATKRFEMFSEGGGNTYGLDFDRFGRAITGTNFGGKAMLYQMQGAYYVKGFSKHGPLHNPYAYGYFDHVPYEGQFKGGHVTCGGVLYDADLFPKEYRHQYIAANLLSNAIYMHTMTEKGSSFTAKHGADLLVSSDPWFRPVDCLLGPDGCIYVADFYDKRAAHLDPIDNWDKTNGRIYRISYTGAKPISEFDLSKKSSKELVELLKHPNKWWRNEARRLLGERSDPEIREQLLKEVQNKQLPETERLEMLWAVSANRLTPAMLQAKWISLFQSPEPSVRSWAIRLVGDLTNPSPLISESLMTIAEKDDSLPVLCQLACTTKRLPSSIATPVILKLMSRDEYVNDPWYPLLMWWGIESKLDRESEFCSELIKLIGTKRSWKGTIFEQSILERIVRKNMVEKELTSNLQLFLRLQSWFELLDPFLKGLDQGLAETGFVQMPGAFDELFLHLENTDKPIGLRVGIRLGVSKSISKVEQIIRNENRPEGERIGWIQFLGETRCKPSIPLLRERFASTHSESERAAVLTALQSFDVPDIHREVMDSYPKMKGEPRSRARSLLLSRPNTAKSFLELIDSGKLPKTELTPDQVRPLLEFKVEPLTKLIEKHYGKLAAATPGEKQARISWLNIQIPKGKPDLANGKELFTKHCAVCHQLFGEGGKIGPDLTTSDRKNRGYLLTHIVDPSLYIRPEYVSYVVNTFDGRKLSGLVSEQGESITLTNVVENKEQKITLAKKDIEEMRPSAVSIMPEKLLDTISEDEVRNLFAYVQSDPKKEPEKTPPAKKEGKKLSVLLISGSLEYESDKSLTKLQEFLEKNHSIECLRAFRKTDTDLPGLEQLEKCDLAIFFTRRLTIEGEQLDRVKKYLASGKPVIGIRTASHGFQKYLEMDQDIFGGDYKGHHGNKLECQISIPKEAKESPLLKNVNEFKTIGSLYKNANIAKDCNVVLTGSIEKFSYPVAWTRERNGQRIFYTSLGYQDDFSNDNFNQLIVNAIEWCTKK